MEQPLDQSLWRRGWNDTKTIWMSWPFYIFNPVVAIVIGGLFEWYWTLCIILFGMFCVWLKATISAPIKQRNEVRNRVRELLKGTVPTITVNPVTGKRQPVWGRAEHLMWAELKVTNTSLEELKDVQVNITKCLSLQEKQDSPNQNDFIMFDFLKLAPFCTYWSERQSQPRQMAIVIPSGATRSALIAFQDNPNGGSFNFNTLNYNWTEGGVKIDVEISSHKAVLWRSELYIECHPNYLGGERAKFEFVEWGIWAANRSITLVELNQ